MGDASKSVQHVAFQINFPKYTPNSQEFEAFKNVFQICVNVMWVKQYTADQKVLSFYKNVHLSAHNYLHFVLWAFNLVQNSLKKSDKKVPTKSVRQNGRQSLFYRSTWSRKASTTNFRFRSHPKLAKILKKIIFVVYFNQQTGASHAVCWSKGRF